MVGETHNQCFHEEPFNSGSTLARVPVFQFIIWIFVIHHYHFQSFRDNHLKDFHCTLCATFTLSAKSYQHEWTHGQHFMQLLHLFPYIEKIVLKIIFSLHTHHSILKIFYTCPFWCLRYTALRPNRICLFDRTRIRTFVRKLNLWEYKTYMGRISKYLFISILWSHWINAFKKFHWGFKYFRKQNTFSNKVLELEHL